MTSSTKGERQGFSDRDTRRLVRPILRRAAEAAAAHGHRLARTLALHQYNPAEHPRDKARQYGKAQRGEPTPAKTKPKA
jgi:hypothetical protein